jgi:CheY-specific phosphatase CheX
VSVEQSIASSFASSIGSIKLNNARMLIVSKSSDFMDGLQNSTFQRDVRHVENVFTYIGAKKVLKQSLDDKTKFHFIVFNAEGFYVEDAFLRICKFCANTAGLKDIPIILICDERDYGYLKSDKINFSEKETPTDGSSIDFEDDSSYEVPQTMMKSGSSELKRLTLDATDRQYLNRFLRIVDINKTTDKLIAQLGFFSDEFYPGGIRRISQSIEKDYQVLSIDNSEIDTHISHEFVNIFGNITDSEFKVNVIDLSDIDNEKEHTDIDRFISILKTLNAKDVNLCFIGVSSKLSTILDDSGIWKIFPEKKTLDAALKTVGISLQSPKKAKSKYAAIDVKFVNPFISATLDSYKEMMGVELRAKRPSVIHDVKISEESEFAIVIEVNSMKFNGVICEVFSRETFKEFYKLIIHQKGVEDAQQVLSYIYKLTNEILENAQNYLKEINYDLVGMKNNVVYGEEKIKSVIPDTISLYIPLKCRIGDIDVYITPNIQKTKKEKSA